MRRYYTQVLRERGHYEARHGATLREYNERHNIPNQGPPVRRGRPRATALRDDGRSLSSLANAALGQSFRSLYLEEGRERKRRRVA